MRNTFGSKQFKPLYVVGFNITEKRYLNSKFLFSVKGVQIVKKKFIFFQILDTGSSCKKYSHFNKIFFMLFGLQFEHNALAVCTFYGIRVNYVSCAH